LVTKFFCPSLQLYAVIDTIIWKTTQRGNYIVKLAYHICVDLLPLSSACAQNNTIEMNIWNLKIPPLVRSFLWRLTHQCLPPCTNLKYKRNPLQRIMCYVWIIWWNSYAHLLRVHKSQGILGEYWHGKCDSRATPSI